MLLAVVAVLIAVTRGKSAEQTAEAIANALNDANYEELCDYFSDEQRRTMFENRDVDNCEDWASVAIEELEGLAGVVKVLSVTENGDTATAKVNFTLGGIGSTTDTWRLVREDGDWKFANFDRSISPDNAKVGQCAHVTHTGDVVVLIAVDCDERHDAEVVHVGKYSEVTDLEYEPDDINDLGDAAISKAVCTGLMDADDVAKFGDDIEWTFALKDPTDPSPGDKFICFVEKSDGSKFTSKVL